MDLFLKNFIPNLKCPHSNSSLREMSPQEIMDFNRSIERGEIHSKKGILQRELLTEALISSDKKYIYQVLDGRIANLLPDRALMKNASKAGTAQEVSFDGKKQVQEFYDDFGWQKTADDSYKDTVRFEDTRLVSQQYWSGCHMRLNQYLSGGEFLLDVASGAIPNDEYLSYSNRYTIRICMDFSLLALKEACLRLEGKGIFILGDITDIPIADNCIDSVISMHTIYHVPEKEQTKAVADLYRVLKWEGKAIIVYSWKKSALMQGAFKIWRPFLRLYKKFKGEVTIKNKTIPEGPELFVEQQNYEWFAHEIKHGFNAKLAVYSAISRSFSNTFLRERAFGRKIASFIFKLENLFPTFLGRWGQYPVFILHKHTKSK